MARDPKSPIGRAIKNRTPLNQLRRGRFSSSRIQQKAPKRATPTPSTTSTAPTKVQQQRAKTSLSIGSQIGGRLINAGKAQRY